MAGERIRVERGPVITIRPVAPTDVSAGDYYKAGSVGGFWLHDVMQGETGDLCIGCRLAEIPLDRGEKKAGDVYLATDSGFNYNPTNNDLRSDSPGAVAILYRDVPNSTRRGLVVWGQH